jgi:hypothetical protein
MFVFEGNHRPEFDAERRSLMCSYYRQVEKREKMAFIQFLSKQWHFCNNSAKPDGYVLAMRPASRQVPASVIEGLIPKIADFSDKIVWRNRRG